MKFKTSVRLLSWLGPKSLFEKHRNRQQTAEKQIVNSKNGMLSKLSLVLGIALLTALPVSTQAIDVITVTSNTVSGLEDNPIPLGVTLDPAFNNGGKQLDVIGFYPYYRTRRYRQWNHYQYP